MLGLTKNTPQWKWAAFGKHPLAGDYFFAGPDDPLFDAFSGWIDNGFKKIAASRKNATDLYSWRFCGKGLTSDTLLCGVGRDSFDCHGRPYPFFIMGIGSLAGYPRCWDLLPFAFENLWSQMEYLCSKRYMDFSQLEADAQRLPTPENKWPAFEADRKKRWDTWCLQNPPNQENLKKALRQHAATPQFLIPLIENEFPDVTSTIGLCFSLLKVEEKTMFGTAFFGGNLSETCLAVFRRPLGSDDFVKLWSMTPENNPSNL
jgi:type VI secretion system protein VasJ